MALDLVALRAAGVGDLLTAVPALRALGRHGQLTLAAPAWLHPLAPLIPGVADVVDVTGLRPARSLRGAVAFNLHGCGPQSHNALLASDPQDLVAFRCPQTWEFGPCWSIKEDEPERERFCRLLQWVGVAADPGEVAIDMPPADPAVHDAIVLHVGGTDAARRWPPESFAELARALPRHQIVITGGPGDLITARRTAELADIEPQRVLAGRLALDEFAAVVAHARLLVTGDTGAAHLAHAYGIRSVVVFGPASVGQWGPPPGSPSRVVRAAGPAPRAADVPVEPVQAHVQDLLEAA